MGLFKKQNEKKTLEQKLLMKRTISNMNRYIAQMEDQKTRYIEAAKSAKMKGAVTQYNLAVNGLRMTLAYQKKAEEMLLNFELTAQMKDLASMTAVFLDGMGSLSRDMSKITNNTDFVKVQKEFEKAMSGAMEQSDKMDVFLEMSEDSFTNIAADASRIKDDEIARLIDMQSAEAEENMDTEIEKKLEEVKRALAGTEKNN